MGGALHRIEVLLVGLSLLLASALVALLTVVRPPASDRAQALAPAMTAQASAAAAPTIPANTPMASQPATHAVTIATAPHERAAAGQALTWLYALTPLLLAASGLGLPLVALRLRRKPMPYTGQSLRQLLMSADATTRADNLRVMRDLAKRGVLTAELAASAGIALPHARRRLQLRLPHITWPHLTCPTWRWPRVRRPILHWPAWHTTALRYLATIAQLAVGSSASTAAAHAPAKASPVCSAPMTTESTALSAAPTDTTSVASWSAEDRALTVAQALDGLRSVHGLRSTIISLDTSVRAGTGVVLAALDAHPDEEQQVAELPVLLSANQPGWRAAWQRSLLAIEPATGSAPSSGGPLLAPVLAHGRRDGLMRFIPLATWPHLGIYGGAAHGALHAILGSLLYAHAPGELALAVVDQGVVAPLYHDVAHRTPLPNTSATTIARLTQALRGSPRNDVRPLLLIVVEPNDDLLKQLTILLARLHAHPGAPLHLVLVQERLCSAGRELYAQLPALITSGGSGPATLLPGQRDWPKRGAARLWARGMRLSGHPIVLDEAAIGALLAPLRGVATDYVPVLWDTPDWEAIPAIPDPRVAPAAIAVDAAAPVRASAAGDSTLDDPTGLALLDRLDAALAGSPSASAVRTAPSIEPAGHAALEPTAEPDDDWPCGPGGLRPSDMATLIRHIVSDESFTTAPQPDQIGLTKRRLQSAGQRLGLFPEPQARALAEALLVWLDGTGVLAAPMNPKDHRLNQPRALCNLDRAWIAERLYTTPIPDAEAVEAAFAFGPGAAA